MTPDVVERARELAHREGERCPPEGWCLVIRDLLALVDGLRDEAAIAIQAREAYRGALVRLVREANEGGMLLPLEAVEALRDADAAAGKEG